MIGTIIVVICGILMLTGVIWLTLQDIKQQKDTQLRLQHYDRILTQRESTVRQKRR